MYDHVKVKNKKKYNFWNELFLIIKKRHLKNKYKHKSRT